MFFIKQEKRLIIQLPLHQFFKFAFAPLISTKEIRTMPNPNKSRDIHNHSQRVCRFFPLTICGARGVNFHSNTYLLFPYIYIYFSNQKSQRPFNELSAVTKYCIFK